VKTLVNRLPFLSDPVLPTIIGVVILVMLIGFGLR
jgi:hypothetical protein